MSQVNYNCSNKYENLEDIKSKMSATSRNLVVVQSILGLFFPTAIMLLIVAAANSILFLGKGFKATFSISIPIVVITILGAHYILLFKLANNFNDLFLYFAKKHNYLIKTAEDTFKQLRIALIFEIVVDLGLFLSISLPIFLVLEFILTFIYLIVYAIALNKISKFFEELSKINGYHYRKHKLLPISKVINIATIIVLIIGLSHYFIYAILVEVWGLEGIITHNDLIWLSVSLVLAISSYICMLLGLILLSKDIQKIKDGENWNRIVTQRTPQTTYANKINSINVHQVNNTVDNTNLKRQVNQRSKNFTDIIFCSQCGHENSKKSRFCTMCGAKLN